MIGSALIRLNVIGGFIIINALRKGSKGSARFNNSSNTPTVFDNAIRLFAGSVFGVLKQNSSKMPHNKLKRVCIIGSGNW